MSKLFKDGNGDFQIECFNNRTYPVYNKDGNKFFGVNPDGTAMYIGDAKLSGSGKQISPDDPIYSPLARIGDFASSGHHHSSDPLDWLPNKKR